MRRAELVAAAAGLGALLAAAGCGDDDEAEHSALGDRRPLVRVTQELDRGGGYPVEGAVAHIELRGPGAIRYDARFSHQDLEVAYPVRLAGRYTLTSYQRGCGGNCDPSALEPPSERCSRTFEIGADELVEARIRLRFGRGCRISLDR